MPLLIGVLMLDCLVRKGFLFNEGAAYQTLKLPKRTLRNLRAGAAKSLLRHHTEGLPCSC